MPRTQISVCKSQFPSAGTAVSLFRAKMVQQRPLLPREVKTLLPDCGVAHYVSIDHQLCLHRLLMSTGCKSSHSGFLDVSCSNGGPKISGSIGQLSCQWQPFYVGLAGQCWRALEAMGEV